MFVQLNRLSPSARGAVEDMAAAGLARLCRVAESPSDFAPCGCVAVPTAAVAGQNNWPGAELPPGEIPSSVLAAEIEALYGLVLS